MFCTWIKPIVRQNASCEQDKLQKWKKFYVYTYLSHFQNVHFKVKPLRAIYVLQHGCGTHSQHTFITKAPHMDAAVK